MSKFVRALSYVMEWVGPKWAPSEVADRNEAILEALSNIVASKDGAVFVEWLESFHARDYLSLRTGGEAATHMARGAASRTDEILTEIKGASAALADLRRRRK